MPVPRHGPMLSVPAGPLQILPGVPLTTSLPKPDYSDPRGSVRMLLTELLICATWDPCARMWWTLTRFCKEVVLRYGVLLYGWPPDIPFTNLSSRKGSPTMVQVRQLLVLLTAKPQPHMYFVKATAEQMHAVQADISAAAPGPLFPTPVSLPYVGRSDIGRRCRTWYDTHGNIILPRYTRDGPKSAKVIDDSESSIDSEASPGPLRPQMYKDRVWLIWSERGWRRPTEDELLGPSNIGWNITQELL